MKTQAAECDRQRKRIVLRVSNNRAAS